MVSLFRLFLIVFVGVLVGSCGGGAGTSSTVAIDGVVTFDRVNFSGVSSGLDYSDVVVSPARGVKLLLLNDQGDQVDATVTDGQGQYHFENARSNTEYRIVVQAVLASDGGPDWRVSVRDNTQADALYVLNSSSISTGDNGVSLSLHASSGWDISSSSYGAERSAAPFAILDAIYDGISTLLEVEPNLLLPDLEVFWSENNRPAFGFVSQGDIGSTFYRDGAMYILGADGENTDEYDRHVILHEWMHFLEDSLSRSDTTGGPHTITQSLDPRLAFTEGLANAFSGIATGSPLYRDSFGPSQSGHFQIDLEANPDVAGGASAGWYVEGSIHSIIYDLYDTSNDGSDNVDLGFQPIYDALTDDEYVNQAAFATIFSFGDQLKRHPSVDASAVASLFASQGIVGTGPFGDGEVNANGLMGILPLYNDVIVDGGAREVCSTNIRGEFNKLGNRQFLKFTVALPGVYDVRVAWRSGFQPANPLFVLYRQGAAVLIRPQLDAAVNADVESASLHLESGQYVLEVLSRSNIDGTFVTGGDVCFDVSVSA